MSHTKIPAKLKQLVMERAGGSCEYCHLHKDDTPLTHEFDHIIAEKHNGKTEESNLALACFDCNKHKGSDIASIDSTTGKLSNLYNPRVDNWEDHFIEKGNLIQGKTEQGRVTAELLKMNDPQKINERVITQEQSINKVMENNKSENKSEDLDQDYSYGYGL
jgi:hypothetical protein